MNYLPGKFNWSPPNNWMKIKTIDTHTEGEPFRVIISGYPAFEGNTILEMRKYVKENYDFIRTALMWEPRGHADMYGCIITPPVTTEADFGILFLHNEGYSSMCGHGIVAITKVVIETGMISNIEPETVVKIDTPSGLVTSHARIQNGSVSSVYFHNVPSFVVALDETVNVPELGKIRYDLAFGGAFYAYVDAKEIGLEIIPENHDLFIEKGKQIKKAVMYTRKIEHPYEKDLGFLYGVIFVGPGQDKNSHSRNVCVFADGEVDRSPTGTGVSGRLAIHYARGEIKIGQPLTIESIIGSKFTGKVAREIEFCTYPAIVPEVEGHAYITGQHEFVFDPKDPLKNGFILR
jgi:trans-L-3-hydroxyproline dehydratase